MTRALLLAASLAAALAGRASAAPVPKEAARPDAAPDLRPLFAAVGKSVESGKPPAAADAKLLRETVGAVFARATAAAGQVGRKLPVDFDSVAQPDVAKELKGAKVAGAFVVAGEVRLDAAKDSVIFATGNVQVTRATNCLIVARSVRANTLDDCLVVAGDSVRAVGADRRSREEGSVLVAGRLVRVTAARGAVVHVIRPAPGQLFPGEAAADPSAPPIRLTKANAVTVLNAAEHWRAAESKNSASAAPKTPIAR